MSRDPLRANPRHIETQWRSFKVACFPTGMSPMQESEMQKAFYAGARAYSAIVMRYASAGDDVDLDDMTLMEDLEAEMSAFAERVAMTAETEGSA